MRERRLKKTLAFIVMIAMVFTMAYTPLGAAYAATSTGSVWTKLTDIDAAAESEKPVAITMTKGDTVYALPTEAATSSGPLAISVVADAETLSTEGEASDYGWTITKNSSEGSTDPTYTISHDDLYLCIGATGNNGVRVKQAPSTGFTASYNWTITNNYLTSYTHNSTTEVRYLGATTAAQSGIPDWRAYTSINNNITGETLEFWELADGEEPPEGPFTITVEESEHGTVTASKSEAEAGEEITLTVTPDEGYVLDQLLVNGSAVAVGSDGTATVTVRKDTTVSATFKAAPTSGTIAEALAASSGDFTVTGVVTMVDGKNIYIQDETGGICLYFDAAPSGIALGDTLIGTGTRADYRGLPELSGAAFEKSEGMTLSAKETTIGALTNADLCTYISIKDLEVTAVSGDNTTVTDANGASLPIYKAVVAEPLKVGDKIDFQGALGIYTNMQLRNTLAREIVVKGEPQPEGPFTVTVEASENGVVTASKTEDIEAGEEITLTVAPAEGYKLDKLLVNGEETAIGEDGTATVAITKNTTVSATFKEDVPEPETVPISTAVAGSDGTPFTVKGVVTMVDGKNIYIQDETGGICLFFDTAPSGIALGDTVIGTGSRATYKGLPELSGATFIESSGMTLSAKETTIGALTTADVCTYVTIKDLTVTEVYDNSGAYTSPNITVKDAEGKSIQLYKAVIGKTDGAWDVAVDDVIDITGAVSINNTTLQLRNTVPSEITVNGNEPGPYDEVDPTKNVYELSDSLEDGDTVLIYNAGSTNAVTSTVKATYYLEGKSFTKETVSENSIIAALPADAAVSEWTVSVNDDGTYTFTQGDKALAGKQVDVSGSIKNNITLSADDNISWQPNVCNAENKSFYLYNTGMTSKYASDDGHVYLEWYANQNEFSLYDTSRISEANFGFTFYKLVRPATETPDPSGDTFGLASTIDTGDEVILFNKKNGYGLGNTLSGYNIAGVQLTPEDGVITTGNSNVVWKVTKNSDGTYSFTQGDKTLGGVVSGDYNNLVVTGATATKWTLSDPDDTDFNYFMYLGDMTSTFGNVYFEYYNGFTLHGINNPDKDAYGFNFYKKGADPEVPVIPEGDLIASLDQLTDGATIAIYSPTHKTAISSKPNGDWYLKAKPAEVEEGKLGIFTSDYIWKVKRNDDDTFSFYSYDNEEDSISVWPSGTFAELTVNTNYNDETVNKWDLSTFSTTNRTWYIKSSTLTLEKNNAKLPVYIEAYVRNEGEVFSGYAPYSNQLSNTDYALQFYLVDPENAVEEYDDGEWDGVLEAGKQYVMFNDSSKNAVGLMREADYSMDPIPSELAGSKIKAGNGAYVFTVDSMGRYYTFKAGGRYLASNNDEEVFFEEPLADGEAPENAKWYLNHKTEGNKDGYILYNKDANYRGSPVCLEYFSSAFSGWTFSTNNKLEIYLFNFYELADGTHVHDDVVQDPQVIFDCKDSRSIGQKLPVNIRLDDLCPDITAVNITFQAGSKSGSINTEDSDVCKVSSDKKTYSFVIPADAIDSDENPENFTITVDAENGYDIVYSGSKRVDIIDEPFIEDVIPEPGTQTGENRRPEVSATVGNVGEDPEIKLFINDEEVTGTEYNIETSKLSYNPDEDLSEGRTTARITVTRQDGVSLSDQWVFTVGDAEYQQYFGQLHSHTTYSDGSGSLETALEYIESLPESANIQFVAFTDHSNYFDTASAANPADALNDKTKMTDASRVRWEEYKNTVSNFNSKHHDIIALGGFEMTWSGGPGHINTFDSDGLVSRNNKDLNNKTNDSGMQLYYDTINKGDSLSQFNHPGTTFGNFTNFSYWDEETDKHMFLVEVGNGEGQIGAGGYYPSYEEYTLALDKGWHVAPTNNQDNHKGRWGNANDARDVILTNDFSEQGIYDAIRALRVYATEDKNLSINYTVNDEPMGTIFSEIPENLDVKISTFDPDTTNGEKGDNIKKVELIADSGRVVQIWDSAEDLAEGSFSAELTPSFTYYYVRVTQEDGDLAVTAPVWTGKSSAVGIKDFKASKDITLINEDVTLTTTLENFSDADATLKSLVYTENGAVIDTDTTERTISAGGTLDVDYTRAWAEAKRRTIKVTAVIEAGGNEYTFSKDCTISVRDKDGPLEVVPIATVQAQTEEGFEYAIEGVVTSNASGFDKDTAFFDCIYVQDETAGICCFPVSGEYKIGDIVRVEGYTDFYQGEPELQVLEDKDTQLPKIEIIGNDGAIIPTEVTAAQINDKSVLGSLVTLKGTIESFEVENGLIQTIMIKDANGDVARVFIDGYITIQKEVEGCRVGAEISATGLASYDDTFNAPEGPFPRIRIRNRADILCETITPSDPADVMAAIDALPDDVKTEDEDAIVSARKLYDSLSAADKENLPEKYLPKLQAAEAKLIVATTEAKIEAVRTLAANILDGRKVSTSKYKTPTANAFKEALAAAEKALANPASTTEDLKAADAALAEATEGLVLKSKNPLSVKGKTATVKYSKLKKKSLTLSVSKTIKFVKKLKDKKTYTLASAKKGSKSYKKYFKISKTTGKMTVKKGLKKGTYKVKVKVKAAGTSSYLASAAKTVTIKIKVK